VKLSDVSAYPTVFIKVIVCVVITYGLGVGAE